MVQSLWSEGAKTGEIYGIVIIQYGDVRARAKFKNWWQQSKEGGRFLLMSDLRVHRQPKLRDRFIRVSGKTEK
jgi:hypothetical protein